MTTRAAESVAAVAIAGALLGACEKPGPPPLSPPRSGNPDSGQGSRTNPPPVAEPDRHHPEAEPGRRVPAVATDDPLFERLEGVGQPGECADDRGCFAAGCSGEICSADASAVSDCGVVVTRLPADVRCGCVREECRWFTEGAQGHGPDAAVPTTPAGPETPEPERGLVQCGSRMCPPGTECVEYFGIAGRAGGLLRSCEIRCDPKAGAIVCPAGQSCVVVADGPGDVCR